MNKDDHNDDAIWLDTVYDGFMTHEEMHSEIAASKKSLESLGIDYENFGQKPWEQSVLAPNGDTIEAFPYVNRVEVIGKNGREFVQYDCSKVQVSIQDDKRTLKVFLDEAERIEDAHILDKAALKVSQILRISVGEIDKTKFVYLYTLLYNMMGQGEDGKPCEDGDENMRHWLNTHNTHLGFCPAAELVNRMPEIIGYLESFL